MSTRSVQARQMARELSQRSGQELGFLHEGQDRWVVQWCNGPTRDQMHALIAELLPRYPTMADRVISTSRTGNNAAWAARAAAALRDGSLAEAIARRRAAGTAVPHGTRLTEDHFAALHHIEQLIDDTPAPDRPSDPADQVVITRLLGAAGRMGSEFDMVNPLLAMLCGEIRAEDLPEGVVPLRRKDSRER